MKTWKTRGEELWKSIENKAQSLDVSNQKPFLLSIIGVQKMAYYMGVKKFGECNQD